MKVGLQTKAVLGLVAIAIAPIIVAVTLVKQVAIVAQSVAIGEAEKLHEALDRARDAYLEAIDARKQAFRHAGEEVAASPELREACRAGADPVRVKPILEAALAHDAALSSVSLTLAGQGLRGEASRALAPNARRLSLTVAHPLLEAPLCIVSLTFATDRGAQLADDYETLGEVLGEHRQLEAIRQELPPSYRTAFALWVGAFALITTGIAIIFARRTTGRIDRLVRATRRVAEGDLSTRVAAGGRDELADLARAFDDMVAELSRSRDEIEYLQKIGAWQEVARRLAHEIKNPLTPIQLAVQQLHKTYPGGDARYQKTLDDVTEIVREEIAGLRRLVDAFSGLAKLPRVEPRPLDLGVVVDDTARDQAEQGAEIEVIPPPAPITVAGDRLLLRRALANLVDNAREAGAHKVRMSWAKDASGESVRLLVEDDGPGVSPDVAAKLFEPYFTTKSHGTGLGLAIVKKTILEHRGAVELLPGKSALGGAAFEIVLPI